MAWREAQSEQCRDPLRQTVDDITCVIQWINVQQKFDAVDFFLFFLQNHQNRVNFIHFSKFSRKFSSISPISKLGSGIRIFVRAKVGAPFTYSRVRKKNQNYVFGTIFYKFHAKINRFRHDCVIFSSNFFFRAFRSHAHVETQQAPTTSSANSKLGQN